jgi:hypothetical protein
VSATRQALRQEIGRLTGDMLKLTATANGTTSTLIDKLRGYRGDGKLAGRIGWVAAGTAANLYSMIRVTGNVRSTFTVSFTDTLLTSATATGDVIELWNTDGMGFYPDDVNSEINAAIAAVGSLTTAPDEDDSVTAFDVDDPVIDIPADWEFFGGVRWLDTTQTEDGVWVEIEATPYNMDIDPRNREVRLKGTIAQRVDTHTTRLYGDVVSSALSLDTSETSVDAEWLTHYVAYRLLLPMMRRTTKGDDDIATRMAFCKQTADGARGKARNRPQGLGLRLY